MKELHKDSLKMFGTTPSGANIFRVIWSEDRLEYRYGEMKRKYGDGRNRWVLEKWLPPDAFGDPATWASHIDAETGVSILGPFPCEGDWEHSFTFEAYLEDGSQGFEPDVSFVTLLCRAIQAGRVNHSEHERIAAIRKRQKELDEERSRQFDALWNDSKPAVHAKIPDHIAMIDSYSAPLRTTADLPAILPKRGLKQITSLEKK